MDFKEIKKLIDLLYDASLTEIEVEEGGRRIRVRKEAPSSAKERPAPLPPATEMEREAAASLEVKKGDEEGSVTIRSPIVGTFYRAPSPNADPYAEIGDLVKKGQILCIVEAMKLMNEIESDVEGKIVEICVEDGAAVEYG